jgi:hypothetical protein
LCGINIYTGIILLLKPNKYKFFLSHCNIPRGFVEKIADEKQIFTSNRELKTTGYRQQTPIISQKMQKIHKFMLY